MSRLGALVLIGIAAVSVAAQGSQAPSAWIVVKPVGPHALDPVRIELLTSGRRSVSTLRVRARSPLGTTMRVRTSVVRAGVRAGAFRFTAPGPWKLLVTDTSGRPVSRARPRSLRVLPAVPTQSPAGFGALGKPGCQPPSPRDPSARGTPDIFGSAIGHEELWALPFLPEGASWGTTDAAVFDGLVGKEVKIVFGMTAFHKPFSAMGPEGATVGPAWGPAFHAGSNWDRQPGVEWGAGFVFSAPGCWRLRVGAYGDLYFAVRS